jgi:RNA polymerase sigma-70 factor (ECF subfamily)
VADSSSTRWTVVLGAADGRAVDRAEFARRYAPVIRAYLGARWRGNGLAQEIDDAVQDVFVDCFSENGALTRVDPGRPGGFRAFLFGVVANVAKRVEARRREVQPPSAFDAVSPEEPFAEAFDRAWAQSIMRQAGELQEERARPDARARRRVELLRLRFVEGHPMRAIAAAWGSDPRQLEYEYVRAREEFAAALHEVVRRHHPGGDTAAECARLLEYFR